MNSANSANVTLDSEKPAKKQKTKNQEDKVQEYPAKYWVFTWFNYPDDWEDYFIERQDRVDKYYVGYEIAPTTGNPHLQGWLRFIKDKERFTSLRLPSMWHEAMGGTERHNILYCSKEKVAASYNVVLREAKKMMELDLYPWEELAVSILDGPIDNRSIYWFWSKKGDMGKTMFCKWYNERHNDTIIVEGKGDNIKNAVLTFYKKHKCRPRVIFWDLPRRDKEYMNYGALEKMKNMYFYSGKYEGGQINEPPGHVMVFANSPPDHHQLSLDRWKEYEIRDKEAILQTNEFLDSD